MSFFIARKEGEEQMGQMAESINPMFELAATGLAPILTGYLTEGIEKVFTKKLEKKFEKGLDPGIEKVKDKIGGVSTFGQKIFGGLKKTVGGIFDGVGNLGKMLSPIDTAAQSFDAMGGKIEKIKEIAGKKTKTEPKLPTPQEILKKEKTTTEQIDIKKVRKEKTIN